MCKSKEIHFNNFIESKGGIPQSFFTEILHIGVSPFDFVKNMKYE